MTQQPLDNRPPARYHQQGMDTLDYVNELTRTHTHREHYTRKVGTTTYTQDHVTDVPPLLHQLRYASPSGLGDERAGGGYESRPAASLDALDTLTRIDHQTLAWLTRLGLPEPRDLATAIQRVGAAVRTLECCDPTRARGRRDKDTDAWCCPRHELDGDVRRWWAQARVVTGWDSPAWRPDNTCPLCGERGTLRVRLAEQVGLCTECRETWGPDNLALLADHIRLESYMERPAPVMLRCWCVWPWPGDDGGWGPSCPTCGTRTCHRATASRKVGA